MKLNPDGKRDTTRQAFARRWRACCEGRGGEGPSGELKRMHNGGISNASARARISASQRSAFTFVLASSTYRRIRLQKPPPSSG